MLLTFVFRTNATIQPAQQKDYYDENDKSTHYDPFELRNMSNATT